MLLVELMQRGGYPFGPNDLTPDQWMGMGIIRDEREAADRGMFRDVRGHELPASEREKRGLPKRLAVV